MSDHQQGLPTYRLRLRRKAPLPAPPPRTRGQRAHLTRERILTVCGELVMAGKTLSMTAIANELGVAPNTIYSRFDKGLASIEAELVGQLLAPLGRAPGPKETWRANLNSLFSEAREIAQASPAFAKMVPATMASRPYLIPRLNERVLFFLTMAGVPKPKVARLMMWIIAVLIGTFHPTPPSSKTSDQEEWLHDLQVEIRRLSGDEFPLLQEHEKALAKATAEFIGLGSMKAGGATAYAKFVRQAVEREAGISEASEE